MTMPKAPSAISRVEFFCDDKRVGEALRALVGVAIGAPSVQPVVNAATRGNGLAAETGGKLVEQLAHYLAQSNRSEIDGADLRSFLKKSGRSPASISYLARHAVAHRILKKDPSAKSRWLVVSK